MNANSQIFLCSAGCRFIWRRGVGNQIRVPLAESADACWSAARGVLARR